MEPVPWRVVWRVPCPTVALGPHRFDIRHRALVMGILNRTPDSFYDQGATWSFDAFLERDATFAWDVGAGALLITEAGGRIEDLDGGPVNLGPGLANVLASNGLIHAALAGVVRAAEEMQG